MAAGAVDDDAGAAIVTYFGVASSPGPTSPGRANGVGTMFVSQSGPSVLRTALLPRARVTQALGLWGRNSHESRLASLRLGIGDVGEDFRL